MIERIINILKAWQGLTRAVESLLLDNIAASIPWLAPLPAAYMMYNGMLTQLGFPLWIAFSGALTVEALGLSAISTSFQLWDYNDTRRQSDQAAPVRVAIVTAGYYLLVVLVVNAFLDSSPSIHRLAKGLLSTLSVTAGVILALRSQHSRRLQSIREERDARRQERLSRKNVYIESPKRDDATVHLDTPIERARRARTDKKARRIETVKTYLEANPDAGVSEIGRVVGVSRQAVYDYLQEIGARGNGHK